MPPTELDLPLCVSCGQVFRWREVEPGRWFGVDGEHWYRVAVRGEDLSVDSNAEEPAFRALFRLDVSLADVEREVVALGPELAPLIGSLGGLRLMHPSCPREVLFSFLCTANNNLARILKMARHLASHGERLEGADEPDATRFPSFERIAALSEGELRSAGFGYRAASIPGVARQIVERGEGWWDALASAPYEEVHRELVSLKSVGPKLADCIALFGFHHDAAAPVDTHLWQASCRYYFPEFEGKAITDVRYRAVGDKLRERFGPWAGWAHQYLFYDNLLNWRTRRSV